MLLFNYNKITKTIPTIERKVSARQIYGLAYVIILFHLEILLPYYLSIT